MLLSMTGYGDARHQDGDRLIAVEVRTVNNRYLKVSIRCPDAYAAAENDIERLVRRAIARGTVSITLRVESLSAAGRYQVDRSVLESYWGQLQALVGPAGSSQPQDLVPLLGLPGVIVEHEDAAADVAEHWPCVEQTILEALDKLDGFRRREGASMCRELQHHCRDLGAAADEIARRAPALVESYRDRLKERVLQLLRGTDASVPEEILVREVSIYADRSDINEEITRLRSHLEQFERCLSEPDSAGRKLDFLCQEMFREVNTIGSKSGDVAIAHAVVDMKGSVEKLREIVQNVE